MRSAWPVLILLLAACGGGSGDDDLADAGPPDAQVDLAGPFYEPDHIADVAITIDPGDWDILRQQVRTFQSVLEGDCLGQPIPSPFSDFHADITIDGTEIADIGIHKKGFFGSLDPDRPSLKVTFDEYVAGQEYLGLEKITLNNARQDPSILRQCLGYGAFAAAGIAVPRCNYAHVRVNGADLGIYVNVETVNHHFTRRVFADGSGTLYEGTLSDFRPNWVNTFDPKGDGDRSDLEPLVDALAISDDDDMIAAVGELVDLDAFYTYWAMEVITAHWDGYANDKNNFFVYNDPSTGKIVFIPWGVDATFQPGRTMGGFDDATTGPHAVAAAGYLANRLFAAPSSRAAFLAREQALLDDVWSEPALHAELDRMEALIAPIADQTADPGWHAAVDEVHVFVTQRRGILEGELAAGPEWPYPLDGYPCLEVAAVIDGTFSTTYGTLGGADPFASGSGTFTITIDGVPTTLTPIGAQSGRDPNSANELVEVFGVRASDGHVFVALFAVPPAWFAPWSWDVGFFGVFGAVYDYNPATDTAVFVGSVFGTLDLAQAASSNGAPVTGSFHGNADVQGMPPAALKMPPLPRFPESVIIRR
jgi:hypothetical protein